MQVEFVTSINKRPLGTKCFTFSEIIHELCLRFAMVPILSPTQRILADILSSNEHMGLLILVCIIGIDSYKKQYLFCLIYILCPLGNMISSDMCLVF